MCRCWWPPGGGCSSLPPCCRGRFRTASARLEPGIHTYGLLAVLGLAAPHLHLRELLAHPYVAATRELSQPSNAVIASVIPITASPPLGEAVAEFLARRDLDDDTRRSYGQTMTRLRPRGRRAAEPARRAVAGEDAVAAAVRVGRPRRLRPLPRHRGSGQVPLCWRRSCWRGSAAAWGQSGAQVRGQRAGAAEYFFRLAQRVFRRAEQSAGDGGVGAGGRYHGVVEDQEQH